MWEFIFYRVGGGMGRGVASGRLRKLSRSRASGVLRSVKRGGESLEKMILVQNVVFERERGR